MRLKEVRKQKHMTLKELSSLTGISISYLCDIDKGRGNPCLDNLLALSKTLQVSIDYLVENEWMPTFRSQQMLSTSGKHLVHPCCRCGETAFSMWATMNDEFYCDNCKDAICK